MIKMENQNPYLIIGVPSFNFRAEMQIEEKIEQTGSLNYYYLEGERWEFKKFCSKKRFQKNLRKRIKEQIFKSFDERKAILINTATGIVYGVATIKEANKNGVLFSYTQLQALEKLRNLYTEKDYYKQDWYHFFSVKKHHGGRQDSPNMFEFDGHTEASTFINEILRSPKKEVIASNKLPKFTPMQSDVDSWIAEFREQIKSDFFIHEAEIQHKLLEFLVKKVRFGENKIEGADVFAEFPQYDASDEATGKRFDVVLRDKFSDETVAYFEIKLLRPSNIRSLIKEIPSDYDKIISDIDYNKRRPFKLVIVSHSSRLAHSLKKDLKRSVKRKKIPNIEILQLEKFEQGTVSEYIRIAALGKYE